MNEIFINRQSIKPTHFTGEKINDEKIVELLEVAKHSPTHKLTEPWHFIVFADEGLAKLGKFTADRYKKHTPTDRFLEKKYNKYLNLGSGASHVVALCMIRDEKERIPEIEEVCAVACAVQNIHLACHEMGIAGYWSTGGATNYHEVNRFLGISEKDNCLGFFYLGIAKNEIPNKPQKTLITKKTKWVRS